MHVDRRKTGNVEKRLGQNTAIRRHNQDIRLTGRQFIALFDGVEMFRLADGQAVPLGQQLYRRGSQLMAPPSRPIRLAPYAAHNASLPGEETLQHARRKRRRTHKGKS
jgi:hypothetical protein